MNFDLKSELDRFKPPLNLAIGIRAIVKKMAGLRPGENAVVLTDWDIDRQISLTFAKVIEQAGGTAITIHCRTPRIIGQDLPKPTESCLVGADVAFAITWGHPTFLRTRAAWRAINEYEVRLIHIDPPHVATLASKAVSGNYDRIRRISTSLYKRLSAGRKITVTNTHGSNFECEFDPNTVHYANEFPISAGVGVTPPGVCDTMPVDETAEGVLVFDEIEGFPGPLDPRLRFTIKSGRITKVEGGFEARWLNLNFKRNKDSNLFSEIGFGANPYVNFDSLVKQRMHEAVHRTAGVFHTGAGSTLWKKSAIPFHSHQGIRKPTVTVVETGEVLIKDGVLKFPTQ